MVGDMAAVIGTHVRRNPEIPLWCFAWMLCIFSMAFFAHAQDGMGGNELMIAGFSPPLAAWQRIAGQDGQVELTERGVNLRPKDSLVSLYSKPLALGTDIDAQSGYRLAFDAEVKSIASGHFAVTVECLDEQRNRVGLLVCHARNEKQPAHPMRTVDYPFGTGTPNPLPEKTASLTVRLTFSSPTGKADADVVIERMSLEKRQPAADADWPREIVARVGPDLVLRFESRSFWTLYRVDYKGKRLGTDQYGSHYGTVCKFKGIGFAGSGHVENGISEQIRSLGFMVDGKALAVPPSEVTGTSVTLKKISSIRSLVFETTIHAENGVITETVGFHAESPEAMELIYVFMHPWSVQMTDYLSADAGGGETAGRFKGDNGFPHAKPAVWVAEYSDTLGAGVVMTLCELPAQAKPTVKLWDTADRYKKFYTQLFADQTIEPGSTYFCRLNVVPFEAPNDTWASLARTTAARALNTELNRTGRE